MYFSLRASAFQLPAVSSASTFVEAITKHLPERKFTNYDENGLLGKSRHLNPATKLLCSTAARFMEDPSNRVAENTETKVGVYVASDTINLEDDFEFDICARNHGPDYVSPLKAPNTLSNVVGSHLARIYDIQGPNCTVAAGHHSWYQSLDLAQLALQDGTIERAIIGAVEVSSSYQQLCGHDRELALIADIIPHQDSATRFSYPLLGRLPILDADRLVGVISNYLSTKQKSCVDLTIVTTETLSSELRDEFFAALVASEVTPSVLWGNAIFGEGEAASGGCAMLMANEIIIFGQLPFEIQAHCVGVKNSLIKTVLVLSVDRHGAYSGLLMEAV